VISLLGAEFLMLHWKNSMRSKLHLRSHPLHPILVSFPIAFFSGTWLAHAAGWWCKLPALTEAAYYLNAAGIGFGLLAAVPGVLDFIHRVPPKSSGKKRAAQHGMLNVVLLIVFTIALFYRRGESLNNLVLLLIETIGVIILGISGWMGGTLVYRNQIGVDHRYANAGKWQEEIFQRDRGELEVGKVGDLKINSMKLLRCGKKRIVLVRTENGFVAFDDHCPHRGGPLSDGALACGTVQCPWHGSQFDVRSGALLAGPANVGIKTYPVKEDAGGTLTLIL